MPDNKISIKFTKGGAGSGHRGHSGRPGKVGGSSPGVGSGVSVEGYSWTATDYEEIDGQLYKIDYQYVIDGERILSRVIKKTKVIDD